MTQKNKHSSKKNKNDFSFINKVIFKYSIESIDYYPHISILVLDQAVNNFRKILMKSFTLIEIQNDLESEKLTELASEIVSSYVSAISFLTVSLISLIENKYKHLSSKIYPILEENKHFKKTENAFNSEEAYLFYSQLKGLISDLSDILNYKIYQSSIENNLKSIQNNNLSSEEKSTLREMQETNLNIDIDLEICFIRIFQTILALTSISSFSLKEILLDISSPVNSDQSQLDFLAEKEDYFLNTKSNKSTIH